MNALRIVPLGKFPTVTSNLFVYHYLPDGKEEKDQILIVDCGVGFPDSGALGVDLVIPDVAYLKKRAEKVVGVVLTHGHEDHIGALPFVLPELPENTPVFASKFASALINFKLQENGLKQRAKEIDLNKELVLGSFRISSARVTHSIPDSLHFLIKTPVGNFYHGSDFKFDATPPDRVKPEIGKIADFGEQGVLALLSDCLGSEKAGYSPSETTLNQMFDTEIGRAKGRVFVTAISSNTYRWQKVIEASKKYGRKIALVGFSINRSVKIAQELGFLGLNKSDIFDYWKSKDLPDHKVTFLIAGSLGQTGSSLEKVVLGKHRIKIKKGDKVIVSSPDYIPGTSEAINTLINTLIDLGAEVEYGGSGGDLHVSGHGYRQELALLINLVSPKYLFPIGGERRHAHQYSKMAVEMGYQKDRVIIPKEESVPTFWQDGRVDFNFKHKTKRVLIDGLGIGDVGKTVLRDRRILSENGVLVLMVLVDSGTKKLVKNPEVISRGFVYTKENQAFLNKISQKTREEYQVAAEPKFDFNNVRFQIQGRLEEFIKKETGREPMVLPIILEV